MRLEAVTCDPLLRWHYAVIRYNVTMLISPNQLWNFSKNLGMQRNKRKIHAHSQADFTAFFVIHGQKQESFKPFLLENM